MWLDLFPVQHNDSLNVLSRKNVAQAVDLIDTGERSFYSTDFKPQ